MITSVEETNYACQRPINSISRGLLCILLLKLILKILKVSRWQEEPLATAGRRSTESAIFGLRFFQWLVLFWIEFGVGANVSFTQNPPNQIWENFPEFRNIFYFFSIYINETKNSPKMRWFVLQERLRCEVLSKAAMVRAQGNFRAL